MNKSYNKWFLTKVKQAITRYHLIDAGDRIGVGLSGGKDSIALLYILWYLQNYSHIKFQLFGVHIDTGWPNSSFSAVEEFCKEKNIPLIIESVAIAEAIYPNGQLIDNPCSLCARLRRGALTNLAKTHQLNKIALGHHRDDFVETLCLNLFEGGKYKVFPPKIDYEDNGISIIRPLVYIDEQTTRSLCAKENLPIIPNPCPAEGTTNRAHMKDLLASIRSVYPDLNQKLIHSLEHIQSNDLWFKE